MATTLEIANQALIRVGSEAIGSLLDTNERAIAVSTSINFIRVEVLRAHSWNCVTTRAQLSKNVTDPLWGFDSAYDLPADCLRVIDVDTDLQWRVEGRQILIDGDADIDVLYLKDETDPTQYDSMLTAAFVVRLAVEICERITDSRTKREFLWQEYQLLLDDAKARDGEEQSPVEFEEDDWVTVRY